MVDGARHVGEQVGVAIAVARDQGADLDVGGLLGPGAEHGPALVVGAVGVATERVEVVPVVDDVDAGLIEPRDVVTDGLVAGVVLGDELNSDSNTLGHGNPPYAAIR
ncbi:hypothetical protein GCM10023147_05730 [Tsukamurella soli]|uniref:Uncharacterized protein n=1 Tax=Tsukamurella soli TaxID=644556 RepID=A0ABP8J4B7_9ACTN